MTLTETIVGRMHTITIADIALDGKVTATLSGIEQHRYALIDGLLWYSIGRKLEGLWNAFQTVGRTPKTQRAHEVANGLLIYVHTVPFHESTEERQQRIATNINTYLPDLVTLAEQVRDQRVQDEVADVRRLATLLRDRIAHPHDAGHGLQGILTTKLAA